MSKWGQARVEVLAQHQEIKAELARGIPVKQIYDALASRGQITVTYNGFRRQVQGIRDEMIRSPVEAPAPSSTYSKALVKEQGFKFNPASKAEDFF